MNLEGLLAPDGMRDELRNLFENNPLGVAVMRHRRDAKGGVTAQRVFANKSLAALFGAPSLTEFMRHPVGESWVDAVAFEEMNRALLSQSRIVNFEVERFRLDGAPIWVSMTSQPIVLDGEELTIIWHLDITDRKRTEANLKASEAQLRDFIESSVDWFWEMDADLRFTYMSPNVERVVGVAPEWHYGKTREDLLGPDYDHAIWTPHLETLKAREPYRDFVFLRVGEGIEHKWLSSSGKPIFSEDGEFLGYRGTASDVTERVENQELRAASQAKSEFLSSMSHELRTPLNAIRGFGQLLENDPEHPLAPKQQAAVAQILHGGAHLLDLINQVLDLAKIESAALALSIEPVDTDSVLRDCLAMAASLAGAKNISVRTEVGGEGTMPFVKADRTRLRQILLNLLSNATKYNVAGGSITVSWRVLDTGMFRLSVADTGRGIPERYKNKVFTPFHRLAAEGGETEGTGIGLSISRQLVEQMGGAIDYSSQVGAGSKFWFDLPLATAAETRQWCEERTREESAEPLGDINFPPSDILYIEDNPANLQLMEMIAGRFAALTLRAAATAEIGIEIAKARPPDLILMDINLPGMSGLEAIKTIRNDPMTGDIPIAAVSANAMPDDIEAAMQAGFDAYITKPFDIWDVESTLAEMLGRRRDAAVPKAPLAFSCAEQAKNFAPLAAKDVETLLASVKSLPPEYASILKSQADTIPVMIADIRTSAAKADVGEVEMLAHNLKASSGTFGARQVSEQAEILERLARIGGVADIGANLAELEAAYETAAPVIERLLAEIEAVRRDTA
jgi:PAS domain S-box-containing protein